MDLIGLGGLLVAVLSFLLAFLAFRGQRREKQQTEDAVKRSDTYQELVSIQHEQRSLIDLYRRENGEQQAVIVAAKAESATALAAHASCEAKLASMEIRLRVAEARINELGG